MAGRSKAAPRSRTTTGQRRTAPVGPSKAARVLWRSTLATLVLIVAWTLLPGAIVLVTGSHGPAWLQYSSIPVLSVGGLPVGCVMWVAETIRRGEIRGNPSPPGGVGPRGAIVSRVGMLSLPAHVAWFVGMLVAGVAIVAISWPYAGDGAFATWHFLGAALFPCAGAALGSLVKKVAWSHHLRSGRAIPRPSAVWRWVTYRWRIDLWACALGFGALAAGIAITGAMALSTNFGTPEDYAEARPIAAWLLSVGAVTLAVGLCAVTQFWRSGEDLASGESLA